MWFERHFYFKMGQVHWLLLSFIFFSHGFVPVWFMSLTPAQDDVIIWPLAFWIQHVFNDFLLFWNKHSPIFFCPQGADLNLCSGFVPSSPALCRKLVSSVLALMFPCVVDDDDDDDDDGTRSRSRFPFWVESVWFSSSTSSRRWSGPD